MLVLTPKYGSLIDIDLLKKQKAKTKEQLIKHRLTIDLNEYTIYRAYLTFLKNKDKYVIGYKPKDAEEINVFVKLLGKIDTLDASWIDVSDLKSLSWCFIKCQVKHIIGLDKWDVSNINAMSYMFAQNENLESIDISGWDVINVANMWGMFDLCKNLESIGDISGWNVSNTKKIMFHMFKNCKKLKNVGNLERWKLHRDATIIDMFENSAIKPLPSWYKQ